MGTPKTDHQGASVQFITGSTRRSLILLAKPLLQFMIIVIAIFLAEAIIMVVLAGLTPLSVYEIVLLDSFCLIIITFPILYFVMFRPLRLNITEFRRVEEALRENEEKYRSLIESTDDSIYLVDREYRYLYMNKRHITRMGFSGNEYMGRAYSEFHTLEETQEFNREVEKVFRTGGSLHHEHRSTRDGRYFLRTLSPAKGDDGSITAITVISKDITELKGMEEKLRTLSLTDELTGLYNRRGFFTLAEQLLRAAKREKRGVFMLYADLDNLKRINDTFGHQEGDLALRDIAAVLRTTYRESDVVARIGGDEFVVLPLGRSGDNVDSILARLQENLRLHVPNSNLAYRLSLSFGFSYYDPESPGSIDELIIQAEQSMYEQKRHKQKTSP